MSGRIKICTELEPQDTVASIRAAIEEEPSNLIQPTRASRLRAVLATVDAPSVAVLHKKTWAAGRRLRIGFLNGTPSEVKALIIDHAREWLNHVNLEFEFVDGEHGDIRISTQKGGSWSYIGTDAKLIEPGKATMNFGWLSPDTDDEEYSRVVLHEFGHALGAIHEHQHPDAGIPWDRQRVYDFYREMGWDTDQVDRNIFYKYEDGQLNSSAYDSESIMHYAIPDELTQGDWSVPWNTRLSDTDRKFMSLQYP